MSTPLAGQHILLTGGGSGIGRAVTERYLRDGATVTVLERSPEHAAELESEVGEELRVLVGDATDAGTLDDAVAAAVNPAGKLHNLTCCVGIFDYYASVTDLLPDELMAAAEEVWRVNVVSHLIAINRAHTALRTARGSVTLTLSESAFHPVGGGVLYGSSKWALRGAVSHLAAQLAPDIRVNGVAPGGTGGTRFGGLSTLAQEQTADKMAGRDQRIARGTLLGVTPQPQDHAAAYSYLANPVDARIVTGVVINTDGGRRS